MDDINNNGYLLVSCESLISLLFVNASCEAPITRNVQGVRSNLCNGKERLRENQR